MVNEVWGVELNYTTNILRSGGGSLVVLLQLVESNPRSFPSGGFITNKTIRSAVQKMGIITPLRLGSIRLNISRDGKLASWENFYPYDKLPEDYGAEIRSKGIAQLAELHTLLRLKKDFPHVKWIAHDITDRSREGHVRSRGLQTRQKRVHFETFTLSREIRLLREKIARDAWKYTPPKLFSKRAALPPSQWTHQKLVRRRKVV